MVLLHEGEPGEVFVSSSVVASLSTSDDMSNTAAYRRFHGSIPFRFATFETHLDCGTSLCFRSAHSDKTNTSWAHRIQLYVTRCTSARAPDTLAIGHVGVRFMVT